MVEVDVHPHRMIQPQHGYQILGDALGQKNGHSGPYPDDVHVRDTSQAMQQPLQNLLRQNQRITPGEEHVPDLRCGRDVVQLSLVVRRAKLDVGIPYDATSSTETAIAGALGGNQHEYPIGIAMYQAGDR